MKRTILTIVTLLLLTFQAFPASFFSSTNNSLGLRTYYSTIRGMGMGSTGLASLDPYSIHPYNTATWLGINETRISILMKYDVNQIDFGWQRVFTHTANFTGLQMAIPLQRHKWVFGFGLTPYTMVNFSYTQKIPVDSRTLNEYIYNKGNISRAQFSLSYAPEKRVGLGFNFYYFFGTINDDYNLSFDDNEYYDGFYKLEYRFRGPAVGFSMFINPFDSLIISGFLDLKPHLKFSAIYHLQLTDAKEKYSTNSTIPVQWGIGLNYTLAKQWTFSTDYSFQKWSEGFNITDTKLAFLEDWYTVGVGLEHAHRKQKAKSLFQKIDLRVGVSYSQIGYQFDDNSVREFGVHAGVGIPFAHRTGRVDVAFILGRRGEVAKTVAQETFFRTLISVSAGELWFQKLR